MRRSPGLQGLCCFFKAEKRLVAVCSFTENLRSNEKQLLSNLQTGERGRRSVRVRGLVVVWALIFAGTACGVVAQGLVADPSTLPPLASFKDCAACPEMVVMPLGSFMMGAIEGESRNPFDFSGENPTFERLPEGEINIITFEHQRHRVDMDIPYAIARNETTHAEWMACIDDGGCTFIPDHRVRTLNEWVPFGPNHPVINVSYVDIHVCVSGLNVPPKTILAIPGAPL